MYIPTKEKDREMECTECLALGARENLEFGVGVSVLIGGVRFLAGICFQSEAFFWDHF